MTQYMEISSPLLSDGGDITTTTTMRYSVADSGVNMTSSDVEHGLNLDQSLHSKPPLSNGLENVQFRQDPYHTTEIILSDAHPKPFQDSTEDSFYTTMLPYSVLAGNHDILEQNGDTQVSAGDSLESGVGMESELSNSNPRHNSMHNMESSQTVVITPLVPMHSKANKKTPGHSNSEGKQKSGCKDRAQNTDKEQGESNGEGRERGGSEEKSRSGDKCKDKCKDKSEKRK